MVEELSAQVEIFVEIPRQYHRDVIGTGGNNVRKLTSENNVQVNFQPQRQRPPAAATQDNGHAKENGVATPESETPPTAVDGEEAAEPVTPEQQPEGPDPLDLIK